MATYRRYKGKRVKHGSKEYNKGTWYYCFRLRGRLYHRSIPEATTKAQADAIEAKIKADIGNRRYGLLSETTFKEFAEGTYKRYTEQHNQNSYVKSLFIKTLVGYFGSRPLAEITAQDCRDYQWHRAHTKTKTGGQRSNASVNREMSTLSKLFRLACEQELIDRNPMQYVKKLKEAEPRRRTLTAEQTERLWNSLTDDQLLFRLVLLAVNLPLRRTQITAITPDAIDWHNGVLIAAASKKRDARAIPLNITAKNTLRQMCFDGQLPLPINDFRKRWKRALIAAGINREGGTREENFHFHDLRTVFAERMRQKGVDPYTIQKAFAHSSMAITDIYMTEDLEAMREAVKRLDDVQETDSIQ